MDAERPSVFSCDHPKARKEHKCCECGRIINTGEKYEKIKGIWDGKALRYKTCLPCASLRDDLTREAYCLDEAPPLGYLEEHAKEAGMDWPPESEDTP